MDFKNTSKIKVPTQLIDQIIGQTRAVSIINKAASQGRHVLLIGDPGTGKSMLGQALSELVPRKELRDILILPNQKDENNPKVHSLPSGRGQAIIERTKQRMNVGGRKSTIIFLALAIFTALFPWWIRKTHGDIMAAASLISGMMFLMLYGAMMGMGMRKRQTLGPKLLVDTAKLKTAPFIDATGAHSGSLLGDVRHDPFQSGGLGTPAHMRVEPGMIHRANRGVLFIDEVATMDMKTQQDLLTAMQEGKYSITGQSERSAGAMVRTDPVPCNFIMVAAGNKDTIRRMHPALRSRIRGYGYEVVMENFIEDTIKNREYYYKFIAQEILKDGKIPHFSKGACDEIIRISRRLSGRKNKLSIKFRELGGIIRSAGDLAVEEKTKLVSSDQVIRAMKFSKTLEQQLADKHIEHISDYQIIQKEGAQVGRVNGLAVIADSGIVLPIESEVAKGGKRREIIATGGLGKIAKEAIDNVSAIIMKNFGEDIKDKYDIYVQFIQTFEGIEGDSASVSVATSIISALKKVPIRQDIAMTGSLSVRGDVLPVGGVTPKIEAAIEAGLKEVIIPEQNKKDIVLSTKLRKKIKIHYAKTLVDVLEVAFDKRKGKKVIEALSSNGTKSKKTKKN
jgi:Lon-like ATP-dependent protease